MGSIFTYSELTALHSLLGGHSIAAVDHLHKSVALVLVDNGSLDLAVAAKDGSELRLRATGDDG